MFASTGPEGWKMSRKVGSEIIIPLETFYIVYPLSKGYIWVLMVTCDAGNSDSINKSKSSFKSLQNIPIPIYLLVSRF